MCYDYKFSFQNNFCCCSKSILIHLKSLCIMYVCAHIYNNFKMLNLNKQNEKKNDNEE